MRQKVRFKVYFSCCIIFSFLLNFENGMSQDRSQAMELKNQGISFRSGSLRFDQQRTSDYEPADKGRYYVKFVLGGGVSFDDISMHMTAVSGGGGSQENVTLDTGGLIVSGSFGYHLSPKLILEGTFGYQSSVETPEVSDADGSFTKLFLTGNIL